MMTSWMRSLVPGVELGQQVGHVGLGRGRAGRADRQLVGDPGVGHAAGDPGIAVGLLCVLAWGTVRSNFVSGVKLLSVSPA
jgi:hypothetical protein